VVELLPSTCEALGSIPRTEKKRKEKKRKMVKMINFMLCIFYHNKIPGMVVYAYNPYLGGSDRRIMVQDQPDRVSKLVRPYLKTKKQPTKPNQK
jgi:hypothetical protein